VKHEKEPMDEYKSRLSTYLSDMVREELEKYDGGFTDEWNDQREKNAEVLGYKLSGKSDIKEGGTEFWMDMFRPGPIPKKYINQLIKKKGELGLPLSLYIFLICDLDGSSPFFFIN
jgi:hypothetical protein